MFRLHSSGLWNVHSMDCITVMGRTFDEHLKNNINRITTVGIVPKTGEILRAPCYSRWNIYGLRLNTSSKGLSSSPES